MYYRLIFKGKIMAHKQQVKGRSKRRTLAKKQNRNSQVLSQQKFKAMVSNLETSLTTLAVSQTVLILAPQVFNVRPLIAEKRVDRNKLDLEAMKIYGTAIVENYQDLKNRSDKITAEVRDFIDNVAPTINVGAMGLLALHGITTTLLSLQESCESWSIDFNNNIHHPLMEAVTIVNDAIIGNKLDVSDALRATRTILNLTTTPDEASV